KLLEKSGGPTLQKQIIYSCEEIEDLDTEDRGTTRPVICQTEPASCEFQEEL
ncbi:uncharacterized, partial [Tachysurus ichikawai]